MNVLNAFMTTLADWLLAPLASMPRTTLLVASVIAGVAMTLVFRHTSNQRALRHVADQTRAMLLCMRLFKDDIRVAFRCQGTLLKAVGLRLWHSLPPMAVLVIPFLIVLTQLALRFEHRPLQPGETSVVSLHANDASWLVWRGATLEVPDGIRVETPALRDEQEHSISWRVRVLNATTEPLRFRAGEIALEKDFNCAAGTDALQVVNTRRAGPGFWDRLLHPGERAFDDESPVRAIAVRCPVRSTPILGVDMPWWGTFLIVSMLTALLARPFLKVQF